MVGFTKGFALDDLEGALFAGEGACEPNLAVAAFADAAQKLVIGNVRHGVHEPEKFWSQIPDLNG